MAAPISNNNQGVIDHRKSAGANSEAPGRGQNSATGGEEVAATRQNDAVSVSNAAQALSQSVAHNGVGNITSSEQAAELAQQIAAFFAENGAAALNAHNPNAGVAGLLNNG